MTRAEVGKIVEENMGLIMKEAKRGLRVLPKSLYDLEDVAQEVCVGLWGKLGKYDSRRGSLSNFIVMTARGVVWHLLEMHKATKRQDDSLVKPISDMVTEVDEEGGFFEAMQASNQPGVDFGLRVGEWLASLTEDELRVVEEMAKGEMSWRLAEGFTKEAARLYSRGYLVRGMHTVRVRKYQVGKVLGMSPGRVSDCIKAACRKARLVL